MLLGGHIKALLKGSSLLDRVLHELQILWLHIALDTEFMFIVMSSS